MDGELVHAIPDPRPAFRLRVALWALLRLPTLCLIIYLLRAPLLDLTEQFFDIVFVTKLAISIVSTPLTRLLVFLAAGCVLIVFVRFWSRRGGGLVAYATTVASAAAFVLILFAGTGTGLKWLPLPLVLVVSNWAPDRVFTSLGLTPSRLRLLIHSVPGLGEVLFVDRFLDWAVGRALAPTGTLGALIVAATVALSIEVNALAPIERAMRAGSEVRLLAQGDLNGLLLDSSGRYLYAAGHGVERLLRFDTAELSTAPIESAEPTAGAQGIAYDPAHREIFFYRAADRALVAIDADSMVAVRTVPAGDLSPGDPWVVYDRFTDTVTLASEADVPIGEPFVVFDRESGAVRDRRSEDAGLLTLNPNAPILYMSFFRRTTGILAYDIGRREIIATGESDARMDRLGFDPVANEVLVPSPMESRVLRYDPATLELRGAFDVIFGVRVLAVDETRHQMLAGSLTTGEVALVDLKSGRILRSWYLGPWLRSIVLVPERGRAYVSSKGTLYELQYADPI